jgi:hypothetical protein
VGVSWRPHSASGHDFGTAGLLCTQIVVRGEIRSSLLLLQWRVPLVVGGLVIILNSVSSLGQI